MFEEIATRFREIAPDVEYWSFRAVEERHEQLSVRQDVVQPSRMSSDLGVMVTVIDRGGLGYAATSDLSREGLRGAACRARDWAHATAARAVTRFEPPDSAAIVDAYETPVRVPWSSVSLGAKLDLLRAQCASLRPDPTIGGAARAEIVDWEAVLWWSEQDAHFEASDGTRLVQRLRFVVPMMSVSANEGTETLTRTFGGHAVCRQGGLEVLEDIGFEAAAPRMAEEVCELLAAPNCPSGEMDLLLAPDQMILQIHESIGHPLELDRILGDERNYAGTSFVTPDMFGSYRYGSELLNVSFDPTRSDQLATYAWDDEGTPAERVLLIENGLLVRGLGGQLSQRRLGLPGVANARAESWNRPPIDRMANLNLEPGDSTREEMIASVERGIYMETNSSWSIDDSRNKFQFGCERGRLIENGELTTVVKKPGYRGISATFWRSLDAVGALDAVEVLGTPFCGKGEPNQIIRVGHASPPCLFRGVDVFGGE